VDISEVIDGIEGGIEDTGGADYITLHKGLSTVASIFSTVLGYLMVILAVGIAIIVALEVLYINVPPLNSSIERLTKKHKDLDRIMGLCLRDARKAIYNAEALRTGRSVNVEYLLIKWKTVFIAYFIVGLVLNANSIIAFFSNIINNIIH
jgi:hypothetical protein